MSLHHYQWLNLNDCNLLEVNIVFCRFSALTIMIFVDSFCQRECLYNPGVIKWSELNIFRYFVLDRLKQSDSIHCYIITLFYNNRSPFQSYGMHYSELSLNYSIIKKINHIVLTFHYHLAVEQYYSYCTFHWITTKVCYSCFIVYIIISHLRYFNWNALKGADFINEGCIN